jgi:deoxyribodipyrimidine photolyase-related protein
VTREVIDLVNKRFKTQPGSLNSFCWPVCRKEAQRALKAFIKDRLPWFGEYQDAMWTNQPFLYHSLLSAALNLKLLDPREVIEAAERAYHKGAAPLNAVEGFIRQILGRREYVRHIYWSRMPDYADLNSLDAHEPLPDFYWDAHTPLTCLHQSIKQTLAYGYAHHIQRLMVTGLYSLLLGVEPRKIHEWYLGAYVDAVEWVEMPNVLGMSQYADGGYMSSKPYAATGKYIKRMSNYCASCPMNPDEATGPRACPFTCGCRKFHLAPLPGFACRFCHT